MRKRGTGPSAAMKKLFDKPADLLRLVMDPLMINVLICPAYLL